jgi:hypothetical protein
VAFRISELQDDGRLVPRHTQRQGLGAMRASTCCHEVSGPETLNFAKCS